MSTILGRNLKMRLNGTLISKQTEAEISVSKEERELATRQQWARYSSGKRRGTGSLSFLLDIDAYENLISIHDFFEQTDSVRMVLEKGTELVFEGDVLIMGYSFKAPLEGLVVCDASLRVDGPVTVIPDFQFSFTTTASAISFTMGAGTNSGSYKVIYGDGVQATHSLGDTVNYTFADGLSLHTVRFVFAAGVADEVTQIDLSGNNITQIGDLTIFSALTLAELHTNDLSLAAITSILQNLQAGTMPSGLIVSLYGNTHPLDSTVDTLVNSLESTDTIFIEINWFTLSIT